MIGFSSLPLRAYARGRGYTFPSFRAVLVSAKEAAKQGYRPAFIPVVFAFFISDKAVAYPLFPVSRALYWLSVRPWLGTGRVCESSTIKLTYR